MMVEPLDVKLLTELVELADNLNAFVTLREDGVL